MVTVLLFPSVLGVRAGITDTAERLRAAGHDVRVVDVLEGRTFDDYEPAMSHQRSLPDEQLHAVATAALDDVSGPFVTVGFSSGCALAEWSAAQRPGDVRGVVLVCGALPMQYVEASWPPGVAAQTHATRDDPFDDGPEISAEFRSDVEAAGGEVEVFTYDGSGHLFNDPSLPAEFQPADAEQLHARLVEFVARWPE